MNQDIINIAAAAVLALTGWLGKSLWDAVGKLKEDLKDLEISLPNDYVKKVDIESRFDKIDTLFEKLFEKLDHKADKACGHQER